MSRDMQAANIAAIGDQMVRIVGFFEGEFAGGTVRLWTGDIGTNFIWDGKEWAGAGTLLGFSNIEETNDVVASGISVSLSGVPVDMVAIVIAEAEQNAPGTLWIGFMSEDWHLLADPELVFSGLLDVPTIEDGADTCTVTISYESQLIDLQREREWRYTNESQQVLYPGDKGFEYVTSIQNKTVNWGKD
ncbi:hypothetical protein [Thioclava sp. F36-6]|uniref:hypothetical protein n=1 Tax=Thioclava sp. F36-6 TaxID=1915316 RepID=UPI000998AAB5|nr:hypothetical protein [Thioclava sp. F36-6]OOY31581.1 hypothetical protein BMI88_10895 [Thioclava sp. F36-6]